MSIRLFLTIIGYSLLVELVLNSNVIKDLIKYKDEPNDADEMIKKLEIKVADLSLKLDALSEVIKNEK